ncbi:MAG TPA: PAS domain-containing protein, partial [Geobacteraceae bacterium]|nr:PAS domain-containing protein [Geobacteraceae bacterium]
MDKTTVLIVEDEAIVAADLAGKLGLLGYEVVGTAASGKDAVDLACSLKPEVVLMDIRLQGPMDGIEAAEEIGSRFDVPLIYLTAHSDTATLDRAKLSGPFGYILKPFEERELSTTIEMALYKHQSDRQLREQKEWLRVTLASIGDAVITCDTDGRITFLNAMAEALTGWSAEDARDLPIGEVFRLINEETRGPAEDIVTLVLRDGQTKTLANHTALVMKDGREVPIEDSAAPILAADGRVIGAVIVFHDVTEKRRAQEALRRSHDELERCVGERTKELVVARDIASAERQRLYDVLETLPVYVVLLSSDYHVPFANRFFRERFGESQGRRCYEYLFNRTEPCEICETYSVLKSNAPHHWYWTGPDGRDYDIYDYPFVDSDGSAMILEMGIDITEQRQAQKALTEMNEAVKLERQRLYDVLETLPAMICLLTPDYQVAFANKAFRDRFGESHGRHCYDYCFGKSEPCDFCESYKVLETGRPHHWEVTGEDGSVISAHDYPFTDVDGSQLILEMDIDITEQRMAEKALRELNETLEEQVLERTAQLKSANEKLRDSHRAALNLMEDAVTARKQTEEAIDELRREIGERKQAEASLRQSNQRLDLL